MGIPPLNLPASILFMAYALHMHCVQCAGQPGFDVQRWVAAQLQALEVRIRRVRQEVADA
jgi:hypothetical protein